MAETNQRVTVTKRMVREGLMRLLEKKPLEKINITELCQEAGINRTTFYRYYELPRDVLTEMQNAFLEETLEHFQMPLTVDDIERFFMCLSEHAALVKLFFQYNSDADWMNIFTQIYNSSPGKRVLKAYQNINEIHAELLHSYLAGGAYQAMNFPLRTSFNVSHRFRYVMSVFSFNSKKFLISSLMSSINR